VTCILTRPSAPTEYAELLDILRGMVAVQRYRAEAAKPLRIAARRLAAGRGVPGFGNGRAVRSYLEAAVRRQQDRLASARVDGAPLGEAVNVLTSADLLGPRQLPTQLDAVRQLEGMQGLAAVKAQVHALLAMMGENMRREDNEEQPLQVCLNRLFLGCTSLLPSLPSLSCHAPPHTHTPTHIDR
jgi:hypothetical protein